MTGDVPAFSVCHYTTFPLTFEQDVWHIWREPNIAERVAGLGDRVLGVHVCDWAPEEPRGFMDRLLPGRGAIDLPALLGAIERTGYRGAYCLEIFSAEDLPDSLWREDPAEVVRRGRAGSGQAWAARVRPGEG